MQRALLAAVVIAAPSTVHAYNVQTSSTGDALRWPGGEIMIEPVMDGGPTEVTDAEVIGAIQIAVASWQAALDGADVSLAVSGAPAGSTASGDGINSVRWAMTSEDGGVDDGLLAKTHLSYQVVDGAILEADVVINAAEFAWSTGPNPAGCDGSYDIEGSMTHELGHLLGLGHSLDEDATMFATGRPCETLKRELSADDASALEFLYLDLPPPGGVEPSPMTCAAAGGSRSSAGLVVLAALLGLVRQRRRMGLVAASLIALSLPGLTWAAQLRQLELGELGARADLVVRGVVVEVAPAPGGELATDSLVEVTECLAGDCPDTVRVRRRGGEQDGRGLWVEGEAHLAAGQVVVLYLRARPDLPHTVIGGLQGALRLVRHQGVVHAARDLRGHRVLDSGAWRRGGIELIDLDSLRRSLAPRRF
jgi:hypothetical protein